MEEGRMLEERCDAVIVRKKEKEIMFRKSKGERPTRKTLNCVEEENMKCNRTRIMNEGDRENKMVCLEGVLGGRRQWVTACLSG